MEEDHPRRSSRFENNENSAAAWCCTAGRGSAASARESLWRLASHLAAVVAEYRQRAIMINSYSFYICKKKKKKKNLSGTSTISLPVDAVGRETTADMLKLGRFQLLYMMEISEIEGRWILIIPPLRKILKYY